MALRHDKGVVDGLLKLYGVRSGALWYFKEGLFHEIKGEKPPFVYLRKQNLDGGDWSPVNDLGDDLLEVTGLSGKSRVVYDGPSDTPRLYLSFEPNLLFGPGDTRLTVGVFFQFQLQKNGRYYGHWSCQADTVRFCELVAMGRKTGQDFLDRIGRSEGQLWQHAQNVRDYGLGILA